MKNLKNIALIMAAGAAMTGCADYIDTDNFVVEKPESVAEYEYLNDYGYLKSYIDRAAHPNFKLGVALGVDDYLKYGGVYTLANANFDMMTAGNAMKYASCVDDNGNMNFSKVVDFVAAAKNANMNIYGHTLAWHSQQNVKYLNSLLADKEVEVDPDAKLEIEDATFDYSTFSQYEYWGQMPEGASVTFEDGVMKIVNPAALSEFWTFQFFIADGLSLTKGQDYQMKIMARATGDFTVPGSFGSWGDNVGFNLNVGTDWEEKTITINNPAESGIHVMIQPGGFAGTIELKYLKIVHTEAPKVTIFKDHLTNGDAEGDDVSCFFSTEVNRDGGPKGCVIVAGKGVDGSRGFEITSSDNPTNEWDNQFFIRSSKTYAEGEKFKIAFDYRADKAASAGTQAHGEPGSYKHWSMIGNIDFTDEWKHFEREVTVSSEQANMQTIAFNLSVSKEANTYYFDNVKWGVEESANKIPMTAEEKKEVLTTALETWIKGMMEATGGYVTEWDLANETVSGGGDDGHGFYPLQSMAASGDPANFFWQDYLGSVDYVVLAEKFARQYFAENGGNPDDLKLFVNDYNLESWWDGNQKVKSLVHWIEKWEANGTTKIDGIGTQMHVSYKLNANEQKAQEDAIVKMFEIMAASGKLVRITELDMGINDESGQSIPTDKVTLEQHKAMADFYKFIVEKYLEIIPVEQQHGITHWCATDSPAGSGWRADCPVGLWTLDFQRKPAYAGFAEGLKSK